MRQAFIDWRPRNEAISIIAQAEAICSSYQAQGYDLTLRQLYYQFVARDIIENTQRSYKRLGSIVDQARLAGLLDWNYIVDRTRNVYGTDGHDISPEDAIQTTATAYHRALWATQPRHVEVWVEKEALAGVVQRAAQETGVNYFSCRGYVSQSEMYAAGRRFRWYGERGKSCHLIHLGDHDPSGIDMTRDICDRLAMFSGVHVPTVNRVALNMEQVDLYQPPPNPAKVTDARFERYAEVYGDESWELDALDPATLHELITSRVLELRDEELWVEATERQERERRQLQLVADEFQNVVYYLNDDE